MPARRRPTDTARPVPLLACAVRAINAARQPPALAGDAESGIRQRLQAGLRDALAALLAHAVGADVDLGQGPVDLVDGGPSLGRQDQVELAVDVGGAALAALLVELDVARLMLEGQGVGLGLEFLGLLRVAGPLLKRAGPAARPGTCRAPASSSRGFGGW